MPVDTPFSGHQTDASLVSWIAICEAAAKAGPASRRRGTYPAVARLRLAPDAVSLFGAPPLCLSVMLEPPRIGSVHVEPSGRYRVVKVLEDVPPDHGQVVWGPIVYVIREERVSG